MKDKTTDYLIIGNSAAGLSAAVSIRKNDKNGTISIISSEGYTNYSKPLITYYLAGKVSLEKIYFKSESFYKDNNFKLILGSKVDFLHEKKMLAVLSGGNQISYKKLLISSGGKPIIPKIRVAEGQNKLAGIGFAGKSPDKVNYSDIKGVFTLTTLEDAIKLKKYIDENNLKSVTILGGGLIGLKTAEAMLELGLQITIIELSDRILAASFDKNASEIIENKIEENSGSIFTNTTVDEIIVTGGKLASVVLRNGKKLDTNLLIIAVGVKPNVEFIQNQSIKLNNGIVVDDYLKTSMDNIYAAGDVALSRDRLSNEQKNIAIWPLAIRQGGIAGMNMSGERVKYQGGFFMNSVEILGIPSISIGLNNLDDKASEGVKVFSQFNPERYIYRKVTIKDDKVVGIILVGSIERAGIYCGLISNEIDISSVTVNIAREDFGIIQLPAGYRKHLVVGEGIEV
ncbi:MAG: NAD(P)/FAD-dependent oxidoreductase [Bacteroidetes bacterium]|nr:NAD(P)/FAD-dependent oxidoreductase [Bacteroidota bacterium]